MIPGFAAGRRGGVPFQVISGLVVAALSALAWIAWMGWDQEYQLDPQTGVYSGPYEAWQVIGCALSLLVLLVGAVWAGAQPVLASAALTLAFTVAWTVQASDDVTGMYGVGMLMLLVGLSVGTAAVSTVARLLYDWWSARRGHRRVA
jgi:hypothetical protein